jgi:anthranilate synthase component 2
MIMAMEHVKHPIASVQFHPESVLTPQGGQLIARVMSWSAEVQREENA